jgi:hypothetical protein
MSWNCQAQQLLIPMYLTKPAWTTSCSACIVSPIGVS